MGLGLTTYIIQHCKLILKYLEGTISEHNHRLIREHLDARLGGWVDYAPLRIAQLGIKRDLLKTKFKEEIDSHDAKVDHIIWRPQIITLRASKDLKKFPMEELLGHFKSECPNLEKEEKKEKKKPSIKKKKILMATWEDLNLSSLEDENEEANLCLMTNTTSEYEDDEEVNFNNVE
ncbi:hypothetical protein CR513_11823, partial [Mucuna pruriens]